MNETDTSQAANSWDTYWAGTGDVGAFSSGGVSHPAIRSFWIELFQAMQDDFEAPRLLDIATGNGAVVEMALSIFGEGKPIITCVDVSNGAIENVERRFPGVTGIVADALRIPLEDECFDIATSQFGVEYAGADALSEAARMVAPGGRLALMLHIESGSIHKECSDSLGAVGKLQASRFVPLSIELFRTGFEAVRGADRAPYDAAGRELAPAIHAVEQIIDEYGEHVAADTVARLYSDVGRIHSHIQNYDPEEVLGWLGTMESELAAYSGRMSSMTEACLDQAAIDRFAADLRNMSFTLERAEPLVPPGETRPLAWVVIARR